MRKHIKSKQSTVLIGGALWSCQSAFICGSLQNMVQRCSVRCSAVDQWSLVVSFRTAKPTKSAGWNLSGNWTPVGFSLTSFGTPVALRGLCEDFRLNHDESSDSTFCIHRHVNGWQVPRTVVDETPRYKCFPADELSYLRCEHSLFSCQWESKIFASTNDCIFDLLHVHRPHLSSKRSTPPTRIVYWNTTTGQDIILLDYSARCSRVVRCSYDVYILRVLNIVPSKCSYNLHAKRSHFCAETLRAQ